MSLLCGAGVAGDEHSFMLRRSADPVKQTLTRGHLLDGPWYWKAKAGFMCVLFFTLPLTFTHGYGSQM